MSAGAQHLMGFILQTTFLFAILYYLPWLGDVQAEGRLAAAGIGSVFLSALLIFAWDLVRAPEVIWSDVSGRVSLLEARLKPRFSIFLMEPQTAKPLNYGNVFHTANGKVHTNIRHSNDLLSFEVQNNSAVTLEGCEAYLSQLRRIDEAQAGQVPWQSLRLSFAPVGEESAVNVPPYGGQRTLVVFRVLGYNRAHLIQENVPVKMLRVIDDKGEYEGLITITANNADAATLVRFRLLCDAPENEPRFSVIEVTPGAL